MLQIKKDLLAAYKEAGMSQNEIAERGCISQPTVSHALNRPQHTCIDTIVAIADALGYDVVLRKRG